MYTFFVLCSLVVGTTTAGIAPDMIYDQKTEKCAALACNAGQECILDRSDNFQYKCQCKSSCPNHQKPVCGSDEITYPNHCELHRTACINKTRVNIKRKGPCELEVLPLNLKVQKSKPVVCYEHDRNELRERLVEWMVIMGELLGFHGHKNRFFRSFFHGMDTNKNGRLDKDEFTRLIKSNETVAEMPGEDEYINPVLQALCSDALHALIDLNSDHELSLYEFKHCLDPHFKPPHKLCELEGHMYKDGAEIPTDCNSCVCACGNWVCTALDCNENGSHENEEDNHLVLDGKEARKQLWKEVARHEVRVRDGNGEEPALMLLKPKKRSKSNN